MQSLYTIVDDLFITNCPFRYDRSVIKVSSLTIAEVDFDLSVS